MKFHHIGVACENIIDSKTFISSTFQVKKFGDIIFDKNQGVHLCMVSTICNTLIELISGETVSSFVKKRQYVYHTCWEVDDIMISVKNFESQGAVIISKPTPAILFNYRKVAFLMTNIGIIELLESNRIS